MGVSSGTFHKGLHLSENVVVNGEYFLQFGDSSAYPKRRSSNPRLNPPSPLLLFTPTSMAL